MGNKITERLPTLVETNPIWLWLFAHGWEDPTWGQDYNQVFVAATIQRLSGMLKDGALARQINGLAAQAANQAVRQMAKAA